ncbi:MAG: hypothetical protein M3Y54_17155 [Bacteroidota bacterium]|nr:hypothetical protein [Bacteroidota bacterium]
MNQVRKKNTDDTKRSLSNSGEVMKSKQVETPSAAKHLLEEKVERLLTAIYGKASKKIKQKHKDTFAPEVFASAAAYDQSVASVVARIQSGQAPPRPPDE